MDVLNRSLVTLGYGEQGIFNSWDTKGEKGRDDVRLRLKNAAKCKKPFNNIVTEDGVKTYLPTLWFLNDCQLSIKSARQWRWEEYVDIKSSQTKEAKNKPEQKWSHFNMVLEALFKNPSFRFNARRNTGQTSHKKRYYKGGR
jgi:hypothetical protein